MIGPFHKKPYFEAQTQIFLLSFFGENILKVRTLAPGPLNIFQGFPRLLTFQFILPESFVSGLEPPFVFFPSLPLCFSIKNAAK
jgi:hypothetical protein